MGSKAGGGEMSADKMRPAAEQASGALEQNVQSNYNINTPVFSYFTDHTQTAPAKHISFMDLADLSIFTRVGSKETAPLITPYKANGKTKEHAQNALFYALVNDHDDDDKTKAEIESVYNPYRNIYNAFTTSYHQQEKEGVIANRWKVIIPYSKGITFEQHTILATGAALLLKTDKAQSRLQQGFYAPNRLNANAQFERIEYIEGANLLDPTDETNPFVRACISAYTTEQAIQAAKASKATPKPRKSLTGVNDGIIDKVIALYDLRTELLGFGYKRIGKTYLSPYSTSGIPGVVILNGDDGKERCYSHHGAADPLSNTNNGGHALDVFDVICILEYGGDVSRAIAELAPLVDPVGQKDRLRAYMAAKAAQETIAILGSTVTSEPQKLAARIHEQLIKRLQVDKDEQPEQADSLKPDAERITRMINGSFWSGSKSKVFLLNHDESLVQFREPDAFKFLTRTFGNVVSREAVEALANNMSFGCSSAGAEANARAKHIANCMNVVKNAVLDHLKYSNQRESVEWRVDMFAKYSRMELIEDKARIVLTHKPFPNIQRPKGYAEIIADYKEHFARFDEFLLFIVAARFAIDRKKAYLWLFAESDWGKGFLTGIFNKLGCCVETSMKEIEAMLEGKPVGRSAEDFKRAFVLLIDEFKTVKSELKQLQSEISLSPKNQLTCTVEVFAKVFTSAESVGSLVTENGVEDQFANRMSIFKESGDITARPLYKSVGNSQYFKAVLSYTAEKLNALIREMQAAGRDAAETKAEQWLNDFIKRNGLDTVYDRFSDSLPDLAAEMVEYFTGLAGDESKVIRNYGDFYLKSPGRNVDNYLNEFSDPSAVTAFRKKKDELMVLMSEDGEGYKSHRINGKVVKAVKLKV